MGAGQYKALSHKEFLAGQGLRCMVVVMGGIEPPTYGL
jgi:hypothetical protein